MDLVLKDTGLFDNLAKKLNAPLEISPKVVEIFRDGQKKYGSRAWSSMIVKRMEDLNNVNFRANGFGWWRYWLGNKKKKSTIQT